MRASTRAVGPRATILCGLVLLGGVSSRGLADEEVLLSLPRDFDVTVHPGGEVAPGYTYTPFVFRFRGERVEGTMRGGGPHPHGRLVHTSQFEGTFRRGYLAGRLVITITDPFNRGRDEWEGKGMATPDGRLVLHRRLVAHEHRSMHQQEGWRDVTAEVESRTDCSPGDIVLQLPVGELQSSQSLGTPPPPGAPAGVSPRGPDAGPGAVAAAGSGVAGGDAAVGPARVGGDESVRAGVAGDAGGEPGWSVPVSPGAAAGAAGAVALTSLLGALWMFGASGLGPGDLLGSAPAWEADSPLAAEPEVHRDGEVNAETGEVWSDSVGGWVGANYHQLEQRRQAEVSRAQAVSDAESRRESARVAEELRASRDRQAAAARREARAEEEALRAEAVTIEPYRPGWTDRATGALEWAEWGVDTSVSVLGGLTGPGGEALGAGYTAVKETAKGMSEGVARWTRGQGGHLAGEGSAWVLVERATVGFGKGVAKVWMDKGVGKLLDRGLDRLAGAGTSQLLDAGEAVVTTVARSLVSSAGGEVRRSVGIAVGKAVASPQVQKPVNWLVEGATGEKM